MGSRRRHLQNPKSNPLSPFVLSIFVSLASTVCVVVLATGPAWRFSIGSKTWVRSVAEILLMLPLVLPPTVVGFILLGAFGNGTAFGRWLNSNCGIHLLFTWQAAIIAATVMSFPLYFRAALAAFREIDHSQIEMGKTLGASNFQMLRAIAVPMASRGLFAGVALTFARALGEFGATMMVAGSIPNKTQTMPLALYSAVFASNENEALRYALTLTTTSIFVLGILAVLEQRTWSGRG